jgi:DUF4097 and DUF4098 domain-containing protein YvlB
MAGPIVLIVIGVLFLLHNLGMHLPIWRWFGRFWPVLIILWGIIKLIEHMTAQREGYRAAGIGAGSIILLLLIIVFGLGAHRTASWDWGGVRNQIQIDDDLGGMFGNAYTFDETVEQNFPANGSLRIVSDRGAISIQPNDDNSLKIVVHKKLYANNQGDADKYNESTKPQITVNGSSVLLNANTNGAGEHGVSTDMDVFVPRTAMLDIANRRGDLNVTDRQADVKVSGQHGDLALNDISGALKINLEKGSIRASKINGDIDIDGRIDDVSLDDVNGSVRLNGDFFNNIRVSKVSKTVTFKSARSDVMLASVPGDIEISGDSLRGTDVSGPSRLVTRSKEIHLEDVRGDLEVETSNGDIEVHAADKLPLGRITLNGRKGDITLVLPPNAGFQVDASTRKGDISSDFSNIKVDEHDGGSSRASGTVGNGAAKLLINADVGDIKINKS